MLKNKVKKIVVHNGTFHADDGLCVAMVQLAFPKVAIMRIEKNQLREIDLNEIIVADIGFGKYDHHQVNAKIRPNGHKYAACGLLLEDLQYLLFKKCIPSELLRTILEVEDYDNKYPNATENFLCTFVRLNNPEWNEKNDAYYIDQAFYSTVDAVREKFLKPYLSMDALPTESILYFEQHIRTLLKKHQEAEKQAREQVMRAYQKSDGITVVLQRRMPWCAFLIPTTAVFVVNPSNRGGFHLQCIPTTYGGNTFKTLLPKKWLEDPPRGCRFVHNNLFLAAFSTEKYALEAVSQLENEKLNRAKT